MIHLTLTGMGSNRERTIGDTCNPQDTDTYWHVMYCSETQLAQEEICQDCLAVWNETETE